MRSRHSAMQDQSPRYPVNLINDIPRSYVRETKQSGILHNSVM